MVVRSVDINITEAIRTLSYDPLQVCLRGSWTGQERVLGLVMLQEVWIRTDTYSSPWLGDYALLTVLHTL